MFKFTKIIETDVAFEVIYRSDDKNLGVEMPELFISYDEAFKYVNKNYPQTGKIYYKKLLKDKKDIPGTVLPR